METVYFLGRFHVLVLHLPLGIIPLAILLELFGRFRPFRAVCAAVPFLWGAGAISAVATVVLGIMHATEPGFQGSTGVELHRWAGVALAGFSSIVAALRQRAYLQRFGVRIPDRIASRVTPIGIALVGVLLLATGHLGGNLTHGNAYLVEFAPSPLRNLMGVADKVVRPRPNSFESADLYLDIVEPAIEERCILCHNDSKTSGGLSFASYDKLMKGGKSGSIIAPGDPGKSELIRRIELPHNHDDYMPKDGKTPLTDDEVASIRVWVEGGAKSSVKISVLELKPKSEEVLRRVLGFGAAAATNRKTKDQPEAGENDNLPEVPAATPQALAALEAAGFIARPIAQDSNLLDVDYTGISLASQAQLNLLNDVAPQVVRLNLRNAGLDDGGLARLTSMTNLRRLRLEGTNVGDSGLRQIAELKQLRYLNLSNTKVSDVGLAHLKQLPNLREVYVWGSAVSERGTRRIQLERPDLIINRGVFDFGTK